MGVYYLSFFCVFIQFFFVFSNMQVESSCFLMTNVGEILMKLEKKEHFSEFEQFTLHYEMIKTSLKQNYPDLLIICFNEH